MKTLLLKCLFMIGLSINAQDLTITRYLKQYAGDLGAKVKEVNSMTVLPNKYNKTVIELHDLIYVVNGDINGPEGMEISLKLYDSNIFYTGSCPFSHPKVIKVSSSIKILNQKPFKKLEDNQHITIYDHFGRTIAKGAYKSLESLKLKPGVYDIKIKGKTFLSNYLLK